MGSYNGFRENTTAEEVPEVPFIGARGFTQDDSVVIYDRRLSVTEKTARGYIRELEDAEYIHKKRRGQDKTNLYTIKSSTLNRAFRTVNITDPDRGVFTDSHQELITAKENEVEEKKTNKPPGMQPHLLKGNLKEKGKYPNPLRLRYPIATTSGIRQPES